MKILFISSRFPYPALKGDQVILFNRLRHLSRKHEITLLTFYENEKEFRYLDQVKQYCVRLEAVKISKYESIFNVLFLNAFSRLPLQTLYFRSAKFNRRLKGLMESVDFDLVHTYLLRMAQYTRQIDKPKVLDLIDCMQLNLEKRLALLKGPGRIPYGEELRRIRRYEREILDNYNASIVVSDADANYLNTENIVSIPLGIDTDLYRRTSPLPDNRTIIFSGNMAYPPNEIAVEWFLTHCFEPIRHRVPDVKLKIVGTNPGNRIRKYHDGQTIFVTGYVESMTDEIAGARVAIAPMQSGYGMHIKLLEAMSCGVPVVCTSSALGVIKAVNGKNVAVADNATDFAQSCITLLKDYEGAKKMGNAARAMVTEQYSWEAHVNQIDTVYHSIAKKGG